MISYLIRKCMYGLLVMAGVVVTVFFLFQGFGDPSRLVMGQTADAATRQNILRDVLDYFINKIEQCHMAGIRDIIIDPGFGFSKNINQNFDLLKKLSTFKLLEKPILVGLSRKSTIYKTLGITAADALNGTTVMNTFALMNGAGILRVHDVKEARECVRLVQEIGNDSFT